ncbi:MAG: hypothetical protein ACD_79C00239G0003 [uncultured bacterium]|nr:MAG: hypothetical protein ACD_79C00239G0003 [uncultured bacterium]
MNSHGYNDNQEQAELMIEKGLNTMLNFLIKPDTAQKLAMFSKNYYDALIKSGFSKEDALDILKSSNLLKKIIN